jgi:hypothetical protein
LAIILFFEIKSNMHQIKINLLLLVIFCMVFSCKNDSTSSAGSSDQQTISTAPTTPRFNRDSAYAYIQQQVDFGPRAPGTEAHQQCKDWIVAKMNSFGAKVTEQDFQATVYTGEQFSGTNIFAQINPASTQRLLFAAHWDSRPFADSQLSTERKDEPVLGADDGASGVGILMEIARLLVQDTTLDIGVDIVFFDLEDYGQSGTGAADSWALGAQHWSRNLPYSQVKPEYGILLDMVGAQSARFARDVYSMQYAPGIMDKVWKLAGFLGYGNYFVNQRGGQITDDHYYVNTIARIPMIDIVNQSTTTPTGFGAHWHTHNDNMDVIDKATIRAVGKLLIEVIYREDAGLL